MENNNHCNAHVGNMERIAKLEAREDGQDEKFDVIFNKLEDQTKILNCLKIGQDVILAKFNTFEKGYNERVELSNSVITEYRLAMVGINTKFNDITKSLSDHFIEYKKFDWFREPLNKVYIKAPAFVLKWACILVGLTVAGFIILHQTDVTKIFKWIGVGK